MLVSQLFELIKENKEKAVELLTKGRDVKITFSIVTVNQINIKVDDSNTCCAEYIAQNLRSMFSCVSYARCPDGDLHVCIAR